MSIEELYRKLDFISKDGFVTLDDANWPNKVQLSPRIFSLIQDVSSPLHEMSALFAIGGRPLLFFFERPQDMNCTPKVRHKTFGVQFVYEV